MVEVGTARVTKMVQVVKHGDAFELLRELDDDSAHAAIVDYPWEFDTANGTDRFDFDYESELDIFEMAPDDKFPELLDELTRVLVEGAWILCLADDRFQEPVRDALQDSEFTFRRNWCWTPKTMGMGYYGRVDHYPIPTATNGDTDRYVQGRGTLYEVPNGRKTDYPTGKPVGLYQQLLESPVINDGETLLEPFCGSAPGAAVAHERGLDYWGCDISMGAVEQARDRFDKPTLKQGTLTE